MNATVQRGMPRRAFFRGLTAFGFWSLTDAHGSDLPPVHAAPGTQSWVAGNDPHYWAAIRQLFSIPPDEAYFNTGTLGACPRPVLDEVVQSMGDLERTIADYDYRPEHPEYIAGYRPQIELRAKAGGILNAAAAEIALVQNATMGLNFIANGLELQPGDEVLLTDQEHSGSSGAWDLRAKRQGIVVKKLAIPIPTPDPETVVRIFADAIGPRTRVMAVPHITSRYGMVLPVREICQLGPPHNIFTVVDGAQAVGQMRVDVKQIGCDAYACSPHKWLLAPPGNGLLYVRQDRQREIWATLGSGHWDDYSSGLFHLMQFGTGNTALLVGLDAALDFYLRIGPERIERRTLDLAGSLRVGLQKIKGVSLGSPTHPALAGAIVTYGLAGFSGQRLQDELWARKKYRVRAQTGPMVRQSVHYYNSPEEIEGTLEVVKKLAAA